MNEIEINGETYVKKSSIINAIDCSDMPYVIVRTYSAGVHAGYLKRREGKEAELLNARRIWKWEGAASLSQIAGAGISKPKNCKIPAAIDNIILTEAIEIIPCTENAKNIIIGIPEWVE